MTRNAAEPVIFRFFASIRVFLRLFIILSFFMLALFRFALPAHAENQKRIVRVACNINATLLLDESGLPNGIYSQYLSELARVNNWTLEYVPGNWSKSVQRLLDGEVDLLFPTQKTPERETQMAFSDIIGGYQLIGLFASANAPYYYNDYDSFEGARIAVSRNSSNEVSIQGLAAQAGFRYQPVYLDTTAEKLRAIQEDRADLAVFSMSNDTTGFKVVSVLDALPFYYAVRLDDTALLAELNTGMQTLLVEEPNLAGTVSVDCSAGADVLAHSREEAALVARSEPIRVGFYADTAPLSEVLPDGSYSGIYLDILKNLAESTGLDIEPYPIDRSIYAYDLLSCGEIDFLIGSSNNALESAGTSQFTCTVPLMEYNIVTVTASGYHFSEDRPPIFALTNARHYWLHSIQSQYPGVVIQYYDSAKECLTAIARGDADASLLNSIEYNYLTKNPRFSSMMEWELSRRQNSVVMASLSDVDPVLLSLINKAISGLSASDVRNITTYHLNLPYHSYTLSDHLYAFRYPIVCILLMLMFFVVTFLLQRQNLRRLAIRNRDLESASNAKSRFLSRISHEIRTPINAIMGMTELTEQALAAKQLDKQTLLGYTRDTQTAARYLLQLVNDILDTSRVERDRIELHPAPVNAEQYLAQVEALLQPLVAAKNITFSCVRKTHFCNSYLVDGVRGQQILMNLLDNAVKFTPRGGHISLTCEAVNETGDTTTLRFVVQDDGIGMSEAFQENLFHPFTQENDGNTSPFAGSGLGLSLARALAREMGGDVLCKSKKGMGTTFAVTLVVGNLPDSTPVHSAIPSAPAPSVWDFSGLRILVCEDHPLNQKIIRTLLEKAGCRVDIAADGVAGLHLFAASPPRYYALIFMDIRMPNMDGLQAAREIRIMDRSDATSVPIVALSANAFDEDIQKSLDAGMNAHLAKPVDAQSIYRTVARFTDQNVPALRQKILVVDDVEVNVVILAEALRADYDVLTAADGLAAVEILQEHPDIAAVITDIQMPGMDGFALIRYIRGEIHNESIAILANTQYEAPEQADRLLALGADDFLYKPTTPTVMRMRLRSALLRRHTL